LNTSLGADIVGQLVDDEGVARRDKVGGYIELDVGLEKVHWAEDFGGEEVLEAIAAGGIE
jgi:hypothetical protein